MYRRKRPVLGQRGEKVNDNLPEAEQGLAIDRICQVKREKVSERSEHE